MDSNEGITVYYNDRTGRRAAEVSPRDYIEGSALSSMNRTEYTYNQAGRIKAVSYIYYDTVNSKWVTLVAKSYKYDLNGNLIKELDSLGYEAGTGTTLDS